MPLRLERSLFLQGRAWHQDMGTFNPHSFTKADSKVKRTTEKEGGVGRLTGPVRVWKKG